MSPPFRAAGFEGDLGALSLVEIVQVLTLSSRTARVSVCSGARSGSLWVRDGTVTHAVAGPLFGELAVYAMLEWIGGRFAVEQDAVSECRSIETDATQLLLEGLRRIDEQALEAPSEPASVSLPQPEESHPQLRRELRQLIAVCACSMLLGAVVAAAAYSASKPRVTQPPTLIAAHEKENAAPSPNPQPRPEAPAEEKQRVPAEPTP